MNFPCPLLPGAYPLDQRLRAMGAFDQLVAVCMDTNAVWLAFTPSTFLRRTQLVDTLRALRRAHVVRISTKSHANGKRGLVFEYVSTWRRGYITLWFHDIDLDTRHRAKSPKRRAADLARMKFLRVTQFSKIDWFAEAPETQLALRVRELARSLGYEQTTPYLSLEPDHRKACTWHVVGGVEGDAPIPKSFNARTLVEALEAGEKFVADAKGGE